MHLRKTFLPLLAGVFIFASCKKDKGATASNNTEEQTPVDHCLTRNAANSGDIISGQYIISFNNTTEARGLTAQSVESASETVLERNNIDASSLRKTLNGPKKAFVAKLNHGQLTKLRGDATIDRIEPDRMIKLSHCFVISAPHLITWNIHRVGYGNGIGKVAWIIDTGIDFAHPDLTVDQSRSKSFIQGQTSAADSNGHGTHVAGIIGAKNNSFGTLGVASGATLISLKVLGTDGEGSLSSVMQAVIHVYNNGKAGDVVNMSLGEKIESALLTQYVQLTAEKGIFFAIAAGNEGEPAIDYSPANINGPNIFTVSAVDSTDRFAAFSNYGNDVVDYAAPGVRILSSFTKGRYAWSSGTSMAAPHVAGLLLLKGRNLTPSGNAINDPDGTPDIIPHF